MTQSGSTLWGSDHERQAQGGAGASLRRATLKLAADAKVPQLLPWMARKIGMIGTPEAIALLVKSVGDKAGFVDVELDPSNPDVVWAASYERVRGAYFLKSGGPGSGLWKSTDAGRTWTQVKGGGLPESTLGRIRSNCEPAALRAMALLLTEIADENTPQPDRKSRH